MFSNPSHVHTDPYEVRSHKCGAARASRLAVNVHTGALLSVAQHELHPCEEAVQAGDTRQVHGAQSQLLHTCSVPLLLQNTTELHCGPQC